MKSTRILRLWKWTACQAKSCLRFNLRKMIPKGRDLEHFRQEDINTVVSHINSLARRSLNDVSATILFKKLYGKEVLDKLGIEHICEKAIHLLPDLIAK